MKAPRAWGSDRAEAAPDGVFLLECAVGKGWLARVARSQTRSEHPGTAVEWEGEVYEVLSIEPLAGTAVRYRLAPWEHGHAIRRIERYDEANEGARHASRADLHAGRDRFRLGIVLSPVLGHLPGAVQRRIEHAAGPSALVMTVVSAAPLFLLGALVLIAALIARLGGSSIVPEWMADHDSLFAYLTIESALRIYSAWIAREPMGSLAGYIAYWAWTLASGRETAPRAAAALPAQPLAERTLQDRYRMIEPLLALLPPGDQTDLELRFGFDPLKWGRRTSLLILLVAGANVLISVAAFRSRTDVFLDFAALIIGGLFIAEQIGRRRTIAQGKPAGSVLGALVRPLARRLLEAARS